MENETGETSARSGIVRCVTLLPSGGRVPEDLFDSLRQWEVTVTTVASPASLMAELGLCEIEFRQRRASTLGFTGQRLHTDNDSPDRDTGERTSDWRDPLIMLVVDPDRVPDLPLLVQAITRYYPLVLRWKYDLNASSKFGPLPTPTEKQEQTTEQQPHQPEASPAEITDTTQSHHDQPDQEADHPINRPEEPDTQPEHLRLTWSQDENRNSDIEPSTTAQADNDSTTRPHENIQSDDDPHPNNSESQSPAITDNDPKTTIQYLPKTRSETTSIDNFDQDNNEDENDQDIASVTQAELAMLLDQDNQNPHEEKES